MYNFKYLISIFLVWSTLWFIWCAKNIMRVSRIAWSELNLIPILVKGFCWNPISVLIFSNWFFSMTLLINSQTLGLQRLVSQDCVATSLTDSMCLQNSYDPEPHKTMFNVCSCDSGSSEITVSTRIDHQTCSTFLITKIIWQRCDHITYWGWILGLRCSGSQVLWSRLGRKWGISELQ